MVLFNGGGSDQQIAIAVITSICYIAAILFAVVLWARRKMKQDKSNKEPSSLLGQYIKSRKDRFCPTVTFEESKND